MQPFQFLLFELSLANVVLTHLVAVVIWLTHRYQRKKYLDAGKIFKDYDFSYLIFFAPVYEEIIFRGIILSLLIETSTPVMAIAISSLLFGLWHVKNSMWQSKSTTFSQIIYAGFILGPILAFVTILTGNALTAMLIHALNNYLAPMTWGIFKRDN